MTSLPTLMLALVLFRATAGPRGAPSESAFIFYSNQGSPASSEGTLFLELNICDPSRWMEGHLFFGLVSSRCIPHRSYSKSFPPYGNWNTHIQAGGPYTPLARGPPGEQPQDWPQGSRGLSFSTLSRIRQIHSRNYVSLGNLRPPTQLTGR